MNKGIFPYSGSRGKNSSGSSSFPIGSSMLFPDVGLEPLTLGDSSTWLKSGVITLANDYPDAVNCTHLKAHFFNKVSGLSAALACSIATNGSGTFVGGGSLGAVVYSSNNGQTWTSVNTGQGSISVSKIYYINGRFIALANSTTTLYVSTSVTGTGSWTTSTVSNAETVLVANSGSISWDGTRYIVTTGISSGAHGVWTATNITGPWTARPTGAGVASYYQLVSSNSGETILLPSTTSTLFHSTTDTITWNSRNAPSSFSTGSGFGFYYNGKFVLSSGEVNGSRLAMYANVAAMSSLPANLPNTGFTLKFEHGRYSIAGDGSIIVLNGDYTLAVSPDIVKWYRQSIPFKFTASQSFISHSSSNMVWVGFDTQSGTYYANTSIGNPNAIGNTLHFSGSGTTTPSAFDPVLYFRIK